MGSRSNHISRKVRNSYIVSTISVAMVLFLLSSVSYLILNALSATQSIKESIVIHMILNEKLPQDDKIKLGDKLLELEGVKSVKYITKQEAAEEFVEYIGGNFEEFLDGNPLPDSYEINMQAKSSDMSGVEQMEKLVVEWDGVEEVIYQKNILEQISSNINKFNLVLLMFGGMLLLISLVLLNNTIRVSIFAKRHIISTMKLVGATKWFIQRPFIWSGVKQGVVAATIATLMFIGLIAGLNEGLPDIAFLTNNIYIAMIVGGMYALGVIISLLFTTIAVSKFIRMHSNDMHLY